MASRVSPCCSMSALTARCRGAELAHQVLVAQFGEGAHGGALDDGAELVGRLGQLRARLDELDAGARVDGEDALDLERAQRIAQRRHRDAEQLHQVVLADRRRPPAAAGRTGFRGCAYRRDRSAGRPGCASANTSDASLLGHLCACLHWSITTTD